MNYEHIRCDLDGTAHDRHVQPARQAQCLYRPDGRGDHATLSIAPTMTTTSARSSSPARAAPSAPEPTCRAARQASTRRASTAPASLPAPIRGGGRFVEAIFNCRKPSIAAINGGAVGVGITMTLPMDVRIAAKGAKIGFIFARRGLVPEAGSAWFLPKLVGLPQALRWCLSGRTFDADEAQGWRACQRGRRARGTARSRQGNRARDDGGDLRRLGRADAPDAVALCRRARPVRTARYRQADVDRARRPRRRARRRSGLSRETAAVISGKGIAGHAEPVSLVARPGKT